MSVRPPIRISALLFTIALHLFVLLAVGVRQGNGNGGIRPTQQNTGKVEIRVVQETTGKSAINEEASGEQAILPAEEKPAEPLGQSGAAAAAAAPLVALAAQTEPHYFHPEDLTEKPIVLLDPSPSLGIALSNEPSHTAVLRLLINENGSIDRVISEKSTFDRSAQQLVADTFLRMRFRPGKIDGTPVKSELRIEVRLEDTTSGQ